MVVDVKIEQLATGWSRKTMADQKKGTIERIYFYKGKRGISVKIETHKARHFAGYKLIYKDLRDAKIWLAEAERMYGEHSKKFYLEKTPEKYIIIKALLKSSMINYQKAFSTSKVRRVKLDKTQLPKDLHDLHDEYEKARHQYAAHGGDVEGSEFENIYLVAAFPSLKSLELEGEIDPMIDSHLQQMAWTSPKNLIMLIDASIKIVDKKIDELDFSIAKELGQLDYSKLYAFFGRKLEVTLTQEDLERLR